MAAVTKPTGTLTVYCLLMAVFGMIAVRSEILELKLGKIRGKTRLLNGKKIDLYLGVPYAEPPVGPLRFQKPVPKKPWTRILDATEYGPSCMQMMPPGLNDILSHVDISEDCLSLNIYAPESDNKEPKAVMVWIHGGGYTNGQGMSAQCEELALHGDIICVTINYRLGIFGFLSTEDDNAVGNYGLWDQHEALNWVKSHISSFGGDPEMITIFGASAGGSSVQHQIVTKYNTGIVKRGISQSSPTFGNGFALSRNPLHLAKIAARKLSCNNTENPDLEDTGKLVACMRLASAETLLNKTNEMLLPNPDSDDHEAMAFIPVEDGDFVPYGMQDHFSDFSKEYNPVINARFGSVDWMVGSMLDEGNLMLYGAAMYQEAAGFNLSSGIPDNIINDKLVLPIVKAIFPENQDMVMKRIREFYTHRTDMIENALAMRDFFGDVMFHQHVVESCLAHVKAKEITEKTSATYTYLVTHVLSGKNLVDYFWGFSMPSWTKCAAHGDECVLLFGTQVAHEAGLEFEWNEDDAKASKVVMTYWTNFAKTGNPNKGRPLEGVATWEEYTKENKEYINIGKEIKMENDLLPERMKLWMYTIPEKIEKERTMKEKTEL